MSGGGGQGVENGGTPREVAERAARLYDDLYAGVVSEPVGSRSRLLHSMLGDLAHAVLVEPEASPAVEIGGVRVGFRYQDGEVLTPEREATSEDVELPVVVLDLGDGEWLTLAELRDMHAERLEAALSSWEDDCTVTSSAGEVSE